LNLVSNLKLPADIRNIQTLDCVKALVKTYLFKKLTSNQAKDLWNAITAHSAFEHCMDISI
jgi:hypothetical protein